MLNFFLKRKQNIQTIFFLNDNLITLLNNNNNNTFFVNIQIMKLSNEEKTNITINNKAKPNPIQNHLH